MIKKIIYGSAYGLFGLEATTIALKFYNLFKVNKMIYLMPGVPLAPYWLLAEGGLIIIAPILTPYLVKAFINDGISDESDLSLLIKQINSERE